MPAPTEIEDPLQGVQAFLFDVFGTVVDWRRGVSEQLEAKLGALAPNEGQSQPKSSHQHLAHRSVRRAIDGQPRPGRIRGRMESSGILQDDVSGTQTPVPHHESVSLSRPPPAPPSPTAAQARSTSMRYTDRSAPSYASNTSNWTAHSSQFLDSMLASDRWKHLAPHLDDGGRHELVLFWHRLPGWPDATPGLYGIKQHAIIGTLSNGSVRTLVDMAKHSDLPWDVVLCSELLGSYKPNPKVYLGAVQHLSLASPSQLCMVATHIYDLRAAASHGIRTVFVRRPREPDSPSDVRGKAEGGEVDLVVDSFEEIACALKARGTEKQVWQH